MKRLLCLFLGALLLIGIAVHLIGCSGGGNEKTSAGDSGEQTAASGDATGGATEEDTGSNEKEEKKRKSNIRFYSEDQADPIMSHGLSEVQGYLKADKKGEYTNRILARYYNNYLLPFTEMLADRQVTFEPGSVKSNWWPEGSEHMKGNLETTLANAYRKMAQDMLPYMIPDPDELVVNLALAFGGDPDVVDKKIDKDKMKEDYEKYLENWDFVHSCLKVSDYGTFWEDNLYYGEGYGVGSGVSVQFTSPKYNRQMLINTEIYGVDDEEHREAFLPLTTTMNYLTEIQEARSHGSEFYIQNIGITAVGDEATAYNNIWKAFKILFPHADEDELRVRFDHVRNGETKHMFVYSQDYTFRFNKYMNFLETPDYSFVMPQFGLYDGAETRFDGAGYLVNINDWYTNGTCDSYMKIGVNCTGGREDGDKVYSLTVEIGGKECLPTNLYRDGDIFYAVNYQVQYGVFYPIIAPFYFSEAVNSGYFTPYVILDPQDEGEGDIPLIPEYPPVKEEKTLSDVIGDGTEEPVKEKAETRWLRDGFGDEFEFPERRKDLPIADLTDLGYHHNEDGSWTRDLPTNEFERSHTLTYDEKGVLVSGARTYNDGTTRSYNYATDINFNPVMSIDRYYDAEGNQTGVALSRYDAHSQRAYERTFYEGDVRPGEIDYFKLQSLQYDEAGDVSSRTVYVDNKPATRTYVNTIENTTGTYGDTRTEYVKTVTTDTYGPDGSITDSHSETVVTTEVKEEAQHAVQKYLEDLIGVKRGD